MRARIARFTAVSQALLLMASLVLPALANAAVWTDKDDYAPGSVVTISGDNSNGAGYLPGETVDVAVSGPNGYTASCSTTVDENGAWSCQITLWNSELAVGSYSYTATGATSGATESGSFTDALGTTTVLMSSLNPSPAGTSVTFTATVTYNGTGSGTGVHPAGSAVTTGSVIFGEGGNANCQGGFALLQGAQTPNASGVVTFTTTSLSSGSHTIRACYLGTAGQGTSDSAGVLTQQVDAAAIATTTSISASTITYNANGSVSVTVTRNTGSGNPTGNVTLSVDGGTAASKALSSGSATFTSADIPALASPNAGSHSLSADFAAQNGFAASSAEGTLTVNQASSTTSITCPASPQTYTGSAIEPCTYTVTGVGGLSLGPTAVPSSGYSNNVNVGTANVTVSYAGDTNHESSGDSETFAIGQAGSTTTVDCTGTPFTFDGDPHGCTATATGVGGLDESLAVTYMGTGSTTYGPSATPPTNAGTYQASASFTGDANHSGSTNSAPLTISQADSVTTVTCSGAPFTFDGDPHGCTATATGVGGLDESLAVTYMGTGATTYGPSTTAPTNAGTYKASASFGGDANHASSSDFEDFTINQATSTTTVTCTGAPFTYNANPQGCTGAVTGAGSLNQALTVTYAGTGSTTYGPSTTAPTNAGTYTASASFDGDANHTGSGDSEDFTIGKANAVCSISGYTGVYDAALHGASGSCTGVDAGGAALGGSLALGLQFKDVPGGTANWSFTGGNNYNNQTGSVAIVITQAEADCDVTGYTGTYDAKFHGITVACFGVDAGGAAAGSTLTNNDAFKNVPGGTANWSFEGGNNYKDQSGTGQVSLDKADPKCTVTGYDVTYDANPHTATGSCAGVPDETTALAPINLSGTTHTNAGSYPTDAWSFTDTSGNYLDASGTVANEIDKADAVCSFPDYSVMYDTTFHGALGSCTGVDAGGTAAGSSLDLGASFKFVPGGTANWSFTGGANYNDQSGSTIITITTAFRIDGFYQPVDMTSHAPGSTKIWNTVKGGQTVPLKFRVFTIGGSEVTSVSAINAVVVTKVSCSGGVLDAEVIPTTATGGTVLRYADGFFIFNWSVPKPAGTCYEVTVKTEDHADQMSTLGIEVDAFFRTK